LIVLAVTSMLIFPLSLGLREKKNPLEAKRDTKAALAEAFKHRDFWLLILTHYAAFIQDNGLTLAVAANALSITGFSNIFGSYLAGYLGGKYPQTYLLSMIFFLYRGVAGRISV
jgi:hypothetical protein